MNKSDWYNAWRRFTSRFNYGKVYSVFGYDNRDRPELLYQVIYYCRSTRIDLFNHGEIELNCNQLQQLIDVCEIGDMLL